jgi:hypothetical protein
MPYSLNYGVMKMEREPQQPKRYSIEWEGKKYILGPDNTITYMHSATPRYDHFYVQLDDNEDGEQVGHYEWREVYKRLGREEEFNEKILNLIQIGCQQILKKEVSDFDKEQFMERFGYLPEEEKKEEPISHELDWISPRRQAEISAQIGFFIHLIQRGEL